MWRFTGDAGNLLEADFIPYCLFCNTELEARFTRLQQFRIQPNDVNSNIAHAIDVVVKCPNEDCGWNTVFGVPVNKEEYEKASQQMSAPEMEKIRR